ncbi:MAG: AEC family transporter [Bacteriovoracaceae bacterium]
MANLLIIVLSLLVGIALRRVKSVPDNAHLTLNQVILYVALPALIFKNIPGMNWDPSLLALCLVPWFLFFVAWGVFGKSSWPDDVKGALILTAGLGNTAFVGFPVIESLYGNEGLRYAIFLDQPGTFLIVSSLGLVVANRYAEGVLRKRDLVMRIILFPPFLSFSIAILLSLAGWRPSGAGEMILDRLASMLTPLALISVGLQLRLSDMKTERKFLMAGLAFKLMISPLLILGTMKALNFTGTFGRVAVMEAAMAPMVTSTIVAQAHGLRPKLAGLMLGLGVPLSFLTLLLWKYIV